MGSSTEAIQSVIIRSARAALFLKKWSATAEPKDYISVSVTAHYIGRTLSIPCHSEDKLIERVILKLLGLQKRTLRSKSARCAMNGLIFRLREAETRARQERMREIVAEGIDLSQAASLHAYEAARRAEDKKRTEDMKTLVELLKPMTALTADDVVEAWRLSKVGFVLES